MSELLRKTFAKWSADDGWLYAAAMAAFAALALAPLFLITLRLAELFGDRGNVIRAIALLIDPIVGRGGVRALIGVVSTANRGSGGSAASWLAALIALFAGSRLFYALQRALHAIWGTPARERQTLPTTVVSFFAAGLLSVSAIAGLAALIFGSSLVLATLPRLGLHGFVPMLVRSAVALLGMLILTPVVALLFAWLPGNRFAWRDVWTGALVTSGGFAVAQFAISVYLAFVNLPWTYGSAASIVVILLWCYYSAYLFLLGAEFTYVHAHDHGSLRACVEIDDRLAEGTAPERPVEPVRR